MTRDAFDVRAYVRDVASVLSWRAAVLAALTLAITLLEGLGLAMLTPLLRHVGVEDGGGPVGRVAGAVEGGLTALGLPIDLTTLLATFLVLVTAQAWLSRTHALYAFGLQQDFIAHLRRRLYGAVLRADWRFFVRHHSADFIHKLTRELENVGGATFAALEWVVRVLLTLVYLGFAFYLSPVVTVAVAAAGAGLALLTWRRTRLAKERGGALSDAYEHLFAALAEHLGGMKTAKSHGIEGRHREAFGALARGVERSQVEVLANREGTAFWLRVGSMAILAGMLYGAVVVLALPTATLALLLYVFSRLVPRLAGVQSGYQSFLAYAPSYTRVRELERACREAQEAAGDAPAPALRRALAFEGVSFGFDSGPTARLLSDVDLVLRAGVTTAVVGPSGAGKSTLADLAVGLLRPTQGRLTVDGVPLDDARVAAWRQRIAYVSQDTFLFDDTVRANLTLFRPEATPAELDEALELASATFLHDLPTGLETRLGERGVRLSGGERQRLSLARALLRRPDLLVLDEPTSALDAENEQAILGSIRRLQGRVTILLIAHRLSTTRDADVIYVLHEGRVVEHGSYEALMACDEGRFRALATVQGLAGGAPVVPL